MFLRTILAALFISLALTAHQEPGQDQAAHVHAVAPPPRVERSSVNTLVRPPAKAPARFPGKVIDHIVQLGFGGDPENMQWQTVEGAKEKDKTERQECGK